MGSIRRSLRHGVARMPLPQATATSNRAAMVELVAPAAPPAPPNRPPADSARERLIAAATGLFCRRGITATGVDAIVERAGTAKATLYKVFGSKERLVETVLERQGAEWRRWFTDRLEAMRAPPRDKLAATFDLLGDWFDDPGFVGCPFINAVGEHGQDDDRMRALALGHKARVDAVLIDLARQAGAADPAALVFEMGLLIDGAIVVASISRKPGVAAAARQAYLALAERHFAG